MGRETFLVEELPWPLAAGSSNALEVSLNGSTTNLVERSWNYGLAPFGNSRRRHDSDRVRYDEKGEKKKVFDDEKERAGGSECMRVIKLGMCQNLSGRAS